MHINSVGCVRRGKCVSFRFCEYCFDDITNGELIKKRASPASYIIQNMPHNTIYYPWIQSSEDGVPQFKPKSILSKWFKSELDGDFNVAFPKVLNINDNQFFIVGGSH
jgi:hypothetical protein